MVDVGAKIKRDLKDQGIGEIVNRRRECHNGRRRG